MEVISPSDEANNQINKSECPTQITPEIREYFANLMKEDKECMIYHAYIHLGNESHKISILVHSNHRQNYVDLICSFGNDFFFKNSTIELSILLMDELFRITSDSITSNDLVAIACLIIASKYEECEYNIPTLNEISSYFDLTQQQVEFLKKMEFGVLKHLQWNITFPLYTTFIEYFNSKGFVYTDDTSYQQPITQLNIILLDDCRQKCMMLYRYDYNLQIYPKSMIAASTIIVSRMHAKIDLIWRYELFLLTGYEYKTLYTVSNYINSKIFNNSVNSCN